MTKVVKALREATSGRQIASQAEVANTLWKRSVGLLGRRLLPEGAALWLEPCNGIHTLGMRFAIDALFLDRDGNAVRLAERVRPWRFCGPVRGARVVIELPAGTLAKLGVRIGDRFTLQ